jgi:hypothetical protein
MHISRLSIVFGLFTVAAWAAPVVRSYHSPLLDPAYPNMHEWGQAGINFAALADAGTTTQVRLSPGDDLVAAVAVPQRIITLNPGSYDITEPLRFADGVTLRANSPYQTKLIVRLRGHQPTGPDASGFTPWTSAILLEGVKNSGIENLTLLFDDTLPAPPSAQKRAGNYDMPTVGLDNLHVNFVRFSGSSNCWISSCVLRNSGNHPLIIESSNHITVEGVEIEGAYNQADDAGSILLMGNDHCLLVGVTATGINHLLFTSDHRGRANRFNVIANSRLNMDVRFQNPTARANLLQECVIAVPAWHNFPPISLAWSKLPEGATPDADNLVYFCTITRDFGASNSSFSLADNPNKVYRILPNSTFKGNVEVVGPAPHAATLWPVK